MPRNYETVCIVNPEVPESEVKEITEKTKAAIEEAGGAVTLLQEWGRKKLAYPVLKKNEGIYFLVRFSGEPAALAEVDKLFRFDERVMRYQTVKVDEAAGLKTGKEAPEAAPLEAAATEKAAAEGGANE